jgi:hypothetical protein
MKSIWQWGYPQNDDENTGAVDRIAEASVGGGVAEAGVGGGIAEADVRGSAADTTINCEWRVCPWHRSLVPTLGHRSELFKQAAPQIRSTIERYSVGEAKLHEGVDSERIVALFHALAKIRYEQRQCLSSGADAGISSSNRQVAGGGDSGDSGAASVPLCSCCGEELSSEVAGLWHFVAEAEAALERETQ